MISFHTTLAILVLVCAAVFQAEAFTTTAKTRTQSTALYAGRRDFFGAAVSTTVGLIMAADVARAEDVADDLAMPSEEDQKKADVSRIQPEKPKQMRRTICTKTSPTPFGAAAAPACRVALFCGVRFRSDRSFRFSSRNSTFAERAWNYISPRPLSPCILARRDILLGAA